MFKFNNKTTRKNDWGHSGVFIINFELFHGYF